MADAPRFSVITPVYDTPADVFWAMVGSVLAQGFGDWELCLVDDRLPSPHVAALLDEVEGRTRGSGSPAGPKTAASSPPPTTPWRWRGASSSSSSTTTTSCTPTRCCTWSGRCGGTGGRLRLHRRGQDRPRRPPLRAVLQARLVAGADADPDVHLPPQRLSPLAGRRGRRLRPRVRRLPGLGPGPEGDRAGARRRPRPPRPLPLADAGELRRGRRRGGEAVGLRGGHARGAGPLRPDRDARPLVKRDPERPRRLPPRPGAERRTAGQHRDPHHGQVREIRYEPVVLVSHCVRSIVETSTYENYEMVVVVDTSADGGACSMSCGRSAASGCGWSPTTSPSATRTRSTSGAAAARANTCCC